MGKRIISSTFFRQVRNAFTVQRSAFSVQRYVRCWAGAGLIKLGNVSATCLEAIDSSFKRLEVSRPEYKHRQTFLMHPPTSTDKPAERQTNGGGKAGRIAYFLAPRRTVNVNAERPPCAVLLDL